MWDAFPQARKRNPYLTTGLGLLHCGSGHRLITEFLLAELSRTVPPLHSGSHNNGNHLAADSCETRETIALAAAWSLGMVNHSNHSNILALKWIHILFPRCCWGKEIRATTSVATATHSQLCGVWWTCASTIDWNNLVRAILYENRIVLP